MPDWETIRLRGQVHAVIECGTCGVIHTVPLAMIQEHYNEGGFHDCPNGHRRGWTKEGSEFTRIQRERDRLKQQIAMHKEETERERRYRIAAEKREARLKKRASAGMCPCCNRPFFGLALHMKKKHPDFVAENVVPMKAVS
jgi:hypothetical protein